MIRAIDTEGMRFYEAIGDKPMREVTAEYRVEQVLRAEQMQKWIAQWERPTPMKKVIYISNSGDDKNDGLTRETAVYSWKRACALWQ